MAKRALRTMRSIGGLGLLVLGACAGGLDAQEESLLPDSEINETTHEALTTAPAPAATATAAHVRLAWGYFDGKPLALDWVTWNGSLKAEGGTASLEQLIYFERGDRPAPADDPSVVQWTSRTRPHYDGIVAEVVAPSADGHVTLTTPLFSKTYAAKDLAAGLNEHFQVDDEHHQISIASIPGGSCGGFASGYERASARFGFLGFGGPLTDAAGAKLGLLRFRATGTALTARLLGTDHALKAEGQGTLTGSEAEGGTFTLDLKNVDGSTFGTVSGWFQGPTTNRRGAYVATWSCR